MILSKFIITPEIYEKCSVFAKASVGTSANKYARRNQFDIQKIEKDIMQGKIGEEGVYSLLSKDYPELSKPDLKIYSSQDKSWDPDLTDNKSNMRVAVKSQNIESAIHFGESWVFQNRVGKTYDVDVGVFSNNDKNHYVAFVALNVPKRIGEIKALVKINWLHENNLFKPMKLQKLQNNKVAVYYDDLAKYPDSLFQV